MNKMVVNHLGKLFVTSDSATILEQVEVAHPAAKMVTLAMQMQDQEVGDHTNFVLMLASELLANAETTLRMGIHQADIILGYEKAQTKALEILETLALAREVNFQNRASLASSIKTVLASKQYGQEDLLADLVAEACSMVMPANPREFNVDNIRVVKILGSSTADSVVLKGMITTRRPEGIVQTLKNAKVVVYGCALESAKTETKGTVLLHNADQLLSYSKTEEDMLEAVFRGIAASGAKAVVTGGKISDIALHFLDKYELMGVKILSKFDLRRLCRTIHARPLVNLDVPTPDDLGLCDHIGTTEVGSNTVTIFRQELDETGVATIIVRGASPNIMDDIERAVDDGINAVKALTKDARFVAGAGACELELAMRLSDWAEESPGVVQYALRKYAEALEVVPRSLAENAGLNATDMMASLYAAHKTGAATAGVDVEAGTVLDAAGAGIVDLLTNKLWGIRLATEVTNTILRVDEIVMARPAGGPKPPKTGGGGDAGDPDM
eukprot:c4490_g1_i1.p1 GENE.c4490_g1_i1~~c4490_g1_i1.p1  ORF type:complete len:558 (-),score=148.96 c4490_g1_i1:11-1504(-)